ncbi:MAG: response regulator [Mariprofundales bacterium]|nr:response regulator [Mariprofundales bacterium]
MRILVVDDSAAIRGYHTDILDRAGHQTEVAINGVEGLEKALMGDFELFLVDVNMPKMDGYEFTRQLRSDAKLKSLPVAMISTEAKDHDKTAAFDAGADLYLVKPVRPEVLTAHVAIQAARTTQGEG